jgi:hypothetical protein
MIYECERLLGQNSGSSNLQQQASVITHHQLNHHHHHHPDYIAAAIALSPTKYNSSFTVTNLLEESYLKKQTNSEIILQSNISSPSSMPLIHNNSSNSNLNNIDNNSNNSNNSNLNSLQQTIIIKQQQTSPSSNNHFNSTPLCNYQTSSSAFQVSQSPTMIPSNTTTYFNYPPTNHSQFNSQYSNTNEHLTIHYAGPSPQSVQYANTNGWYSSNTDPRFTSK